MRILAFETSAKAAGCALLEDGILLGESYLNTGMTHSQTLMVMAENLLHSCGFTPSDVDAVAVAAGPGSFTGVRIGVAAAKGFAWGREHPGGHGPGLRRLGGLRGSGDGRPEKPGVYRLV